jgi:hypothetical protein
VYDPGVAAPNVQILPVPDVGVGAGPWASGWIPATVASVGRLGLAVATNQADLIILLGSAIGTEPIDVTNPLEIQNQLGTFYGGAGSQNADVQNISGCAYYAFVRFAPPQGTQDPQAIPPTVGATFEITEAGGGGGSGTDWNVREVTAGTYTAVDGDFFVCDTSAGNVIITGPSTKGASWGASKVSAPDVNEVVLSVALGNINGLPEQTIGLQWASYTMLGYGTGAIISDESSP